MLTLDMTGIEYVKAEHFRDLAKRLESRTDKAVEYKFQNVSAVMRLLGLPYIEGRNPKANFQKLLVEMVEAYLHDHPGFFAKADAPAAAIPQGESGSLIEDTAPNGDRPSRQTGHDNPRTLRKYDWAARENRNRNLGRAGEELVLSYEKKRLTEAGRADLADKIEWISKDKGDGYGYDILSFEDDGSPRYIEVKTTVGGRSTPFYFTSNEAEFSKDNPDQYFLYRVFDFNRQPKFFKARGSLLSICTSRPISYVGSF